jgi:hypothetical protein
MTSMEGFGLVLDEDYPFVLELLCIPPSVHGYIASVRMFNLDLVMHSKSDQFYHLT